MSHSKLNLAKLNAPQREAVRHVDGPLLVLAGAGSGKTTTMAHRIASLVADQGVPARSILGLSFTNKAAAELKERVTKLVTSVSGPQAAQGLTISTFHSLCARILRRWGDKLGYTPQFTILDQSDQHELIRKLLKDVKIDDRKFDPGWVGFQFGQAKNRFLEGEAAVAHLLDLMGPGKKNDPTDYAVAAASVFPRYQDQLRLQNAMDFDDLIYNSVRLLAQSPDLRDGLSRRFRFILVDEYQDTNPAQFRLLELLTATHQNLCVVGDDDQSIYGWRGADSTHILRFGDHFDGARVITLDQNYRSTSTILDAANHVISKNRVRHPKRLWSDKGKGEPIELLVVPGDREEAETVAEEIQLLAYDFVDGARVKARAWKEFAILYRSNAQSRLFEEALRMRQIPYKIVGGMSFLDRKEIKDALAYWRLIVNPRDDTSVRRIVNWPTRGIGKTAIERAGALATERGLCFMDALRLAAAEETSATSGAGEPLPARSLIPIRNFLKLIDSLRAELDRLPLTGEALSRWGRESLARIDFKRGLDEDHEEPAKSQMRWDSVTELANALGQMPVEALAAQESAAARDAGASMAAPSTSASPPAIALREYLARLALQAQDEREEREKNDREAAADGTRDEVTLLTLHGAKGLEFPVVFLVGLEDGSLPHQRSIDEGQDLSEERRLCYVGITRAKERLFLTRASERIRWGKTVPRNPSRFLAEIPPELILVRGNAANPGAPAVESPDRVKNILAAIKSGLKDQARLSGRKP